MYIYIYFTYIIHLFFLLKYVFSLLFDSDFKDYVYFRLYNLHLIYLPLNTWHKTNKQIDYFHLFTSNQELIKIQKPKNNR